ncbi:hypothetical protein M3Y96_00643400 [Aphelenchoides besseyi]|nr:hypothetical protein M3Y96_00643400 [Aphelenchoides besseyi]
MSSSYCDFEDSVDYMQRLLIVSVFLPFLLNLLSIAFLVYTTYLTINLQNMVDASTAAAHWFIQKTWKIGIGKTLKFRLNEFASTRPDLQPLIQSPSIY